MLVYQGLKSDFMDDVERDAIVERIRERFEQRLHRPSPAEVRSWQNSMQHMYKVLNTEDIPSACGVAIEFGVPYTSSRIDFLLTGRSDGEPETRDAAVIIELKQWERVETVDDQDGVIRVRTFVGGANRVVPHPSYQAWSYARMIADYNEAVREQQIDLAPCAYLHNYRAPSVAAPDPLTDPRYTAYLAEAPAFHAGDVHALRDFITRRITHADHGETLFHIESGRLRPSKSLQDALTGMLEGNPEFTLIDDQKVVFETALALARTAHRSGDKHVLIVRGGPGTGKSVVAVNLLVRLTAEEMVSTYVSKNSAPRNVYSRLLRARDRSKAYIDALFRGSGGFYDLAENAFDALVIDEAHRLNEKSGFYGNQGENQIKELINAARLSVFFIDDNQRVKLDDIGSVADIRLMAERAGARIWEAELTSQFRCNGSDSYLEWLDDVLDITPAEDKAFAEFDYDFRVFDDPNDLAEAIERANERNNKSRVVAGYCWNWDSKRRADTNHHDIVLPEYGFGRSWNLDSTPTWAIDAGSVEQVGCVHTSQGLEFDYVGVIVGDDMRFENSQVVTDRTKRARTDQSLKGIGKLAKTDAERAERLADEIIRNTYRVLMTRGLKGCFVFCADPALAEYLNSRIPSTSYMLRELPPPLAAEDERKAE